jgi:hypothetical protein
LPAALFKSAMVKGENTIDRRFFMCRAQTARVNHRSRAFFEDIHPRVVRDGKFRTTKASKQKFPAEVHHHHGVGDYEGVPLLCMKQIGDRLHAPSEIIADVPLGSM